MLTPEDYGLTGVQTLTQVADTRLEPGHHQFWSAWSERVWQSPTRLREIAGGDTGGGDAGVTHVIESIGGVRVGALLTRPEGPVRAVVIELHGSSPSALVDSNPLAEKGVAALKLRVRGFAGSQFDTGDLTAHETGWITVGIERAEDWILGGALADVVCAVRSLRAMFGEGVRIGLRGESFGGGLAVLAASALVGHGDAWRLAIGLPSLGDWHWRLTHACHGGMGEQVAAYVRLHRAAEKEIVHSLRLFDAALHARRVTCPTLCKLAMLDEVAPAPAAAAVYNALGCEASRKFRLVTRYGHFDGGIKDLRLHALFEKMATGFLDPTAEPGVRNHNGAV
jgi:cephalosporin-C deacetylase-like acetyl esterase